MHCQKKTTTLNDKQDQRQNETYALVELSHAALGHGGLIATVDLGDVVALDVLVLLSVHGQEAGKRNSQIVTKRTLLASLVLEIIDQLAVLAVLSRENLLELEDGCVDGDASVLLEDFDDGRKDLFPDSHLLRSVILGTLLSFKWDIMVIPCRGLVVNALEGV